MHLRTALQATVAVASLCIATLAAGFGPAQAAPIIGVVGPNTLVQFDSSAPGTVTQSLTVTGLGGEVIRGIDTRPLNGQLYAIGQNGTLFNVDTTTGAATTIGPVATVSSRDLDFGFAFNPVPDRIRTVTSTDMNLRTNPDTAATIVDGTLAYAAGDQNAGVNPNVTAVAYTNQVAGTVTSTALYGIDAATNSLVLQNPPNDGTLTTIGGLGVTLFPNGFGLGFDIDGLTGTAFASLTTSIGGNALYTINLSTGSATMIADFGVNTVRDIAVGSLGSVAVPEPATLALFGVGLASLGLVRRRRQAR